MAVDASTLILAVALQAAIVLLLEDCCRTLLPILPGGVVSRAFATPAIARLQKGAAMPPSAM